MKKTLVLLTLSAISALAGEMTGYISDEKCANAGAKAAAAKEWIQPSAFESCVQHCVKAGSAAVFVTEDNKILKLDAESMKKITPHLGHKVVVTGTAHDGTLKIDSIRSVQM
jgi:hypothetical protein